MINKTRRSVLASLGVASAGVLGLPQVAYTQSFPVKPLRLVVPFPAGGPTDLVARPIALALSQVLAQQVVVDNRGGAGGTIGADVVSKSAPDGYTLLLGTVGTQAINAGLYRKLPYDPVRDFVPLAVLAMAPVVAVAHPGAPFKNIAELITVSKRAPGTTGFGSAGNGTPGHLTGHVFAKSAGVEFAHIPYRGSAPAMTDLLAGQILLMFDPLQSVLAHAQAGKILALAVSGAVRSKALPNVPTFSEAGVRGVDTTAWWGLYAPAATPAPVLQALGAAVRSAMRAGEFQGRMEALGVQIPALSEAALPGFHKQELDKWVLAVRESGAQAE